MEKVAIFDTSYGTFNMGDFIICKCANEELHNIINNKFVVRTGTHNPQYVFYQYTKKSDKVKFYNDCKFKFVLGTNIIKENLFKRSIDWNIDIFNYKFYENTILVGVGLDGTFSKPKNMYTNHIYNKILNKDFFHSTRDEKTKIFLNNLGFKAINTGCPTMWIFTKDFCEKIPTKKSKNVVFTLTDYRENEKSDILLLEILKQKYKKLSFWCQGSNDYDYLKKISGDYFDEIEIIYPNLDFYEKFLNENDVDYVGTRLHAGIFALRHLKRTIIIGVDNRVTDMKETYNLPTIDRKEISSKLGEMIDNEFKTNINIDEDSINEWKAQFK